jgi:nucleotide-binding universal stress UspA family protein
MRKVLVPVDGSEHSLNVAKYLIRQAGEFTTPLEIHLLNAQHPLPGTIRGVAEQARQFHHEEGLKALESTRKLLDEAKLPYAYHVVVGEAASAIAQAVSEHQCDHVVMGTRGMGGVRNMLLGSVATKVLHAVDVPVTLVK